MIASVGEIVVTGSGAELRVTGTGPDAVVCVNGGGRAEVPGTWSTTVEWLVEQLAQRFTGLRFGEVRYRVKSWRRIDLCVEDALGAIAALEPERTLMLGFSMGGSVSVRVAAQPSVTGVLAIAPWLPEQLDLSTLDGKRLAIVHGSLDSPLPGIPGVTASSSRRAYERAVALGIDASYSVIRGGLHGAAIRGPWGRPVVLPRAGAWLAAVADELERFEGSR
jgi:pimeloyl-ACP methyl ester carboxylesterase